jgi:4-oxalocrotonate tautomerase
VHSSGVDGDALGLPHGHHHITHQEITMPFVNIQITREGATAEQKAELIQGVTDLLQRVLNKNPATTFVIIDEVDTDNWGIAGKSVTALRAQQQQQQ